MNVCMQKRDRFIFFPREEKGVCMCVCFLNKAVGLKNPCENRSYSLVNHFLTARCPKLSLSQSFYESTFVNIRN